MKVSIIVPVYNTEKYLRRCLDSILKQDYKDIEVIIVDDGSTDCSSQIIDEYLFQYPNFHVIKQENKGVGAARNAGLKKATGEYITFVDSDDFIYPDYCSYLMETIGDADIAVAGREKYVLGEYKNSKKVSEIMYLKGIDCINLMMSSKYNTRPVWGKMYKSGAISGISFIEGHVFEELRFSADTFLLAKKVVFVDKDLYSYQVREGSITTDNYNLVVKDLVLAVDYIYRLLLENSLFPLCENDFKLWVVRTFVYLLDLFNNYCVDIALFKKYTDILVTIYKEIGGIGGRV